MSPIWEPLLVLEVELAKTLLLILGTVLGKTLLLYKIFKTESDCVEVLESVLDSLLCNVPFDLVGND